MPSTVQRIAAASVASLVAVLISSCGGGSRSFPIPPKPKIEVTDGSSRAGNRVRRNVLVVPSMNALAVADAVLEAQVRQVTDQVALRELLEAAALINLSKQSVAPRIMIGTAIQATSSCGGLVGQLLATYFPDDLDWATRVVKRESGCTPTAVNWHEGCDTSGRTNSHAQGLFQMCVPLHDAIFASVGCSGNYLDAECNVKASRALYNAAGRAPWGG